MGLPCRLVVNTGLQRIECGTHAVEANLGREILVSSDRLLQPVPKPQLVLRWYVSLRVHMGVGR